MEILSCNRWLRFNFGSNPVIPIRNTWSSTDFRKVDFVHSINQSGNKMEFVDCAALAVHRYHIMLKEGTWHGGALSSF